MLEASAGFVAWAGASLVVLGDGRKGLALGLAVASAGLAALTWQDSGFLAGTAILAGGALAAAGRLGSGAPGWQIMPPASTPRIVLCVAAALLSLWFSLAVTTGSGAGLRFAILVCLALAPARILWSDERDVELTAASLLALTVGVASTFGPVGGVAWPYAAAVAAAAIGWLPERWRRAG